MLICYNYLGQVKAEIPENLPRIIAAELLLRLQRRADFPAISDDAEEEDKYEQESP